MPREWRTPNTGCIFHKTSLSLNSSCSITRLMEVTILITFKIFLRKDVAFLSVTWDNLDSDLLTKQVAIFMCKQSL